MTTKKLLIETLNQLSPEDFAEFKSLIELEKDLSSKPRGRLETANTQDVVELMEETYRGESVEETRKALMKMNRTDLVQRLSDKQFPPLSQRVETMESLIELLLETLADLRGSEPENFIEILEREGGSLVLRNLLFMSHLHDVQDEVFLMMRTFGQQSVKKIVEVLKEMKRTDLAQRLTDCSSEAQNKHLDEHLSALIHKVATMAAVTDLLLETLEDLSDQDLNKFMLFLQFTRFQKSLPQIELRIDRRETVNNIIDKCGHQSVEVIREVLTDMPDLVQRLSESSSGLKAAGSSAEGFDVEETEKEKHSEDERWPALIHKVETMESVIELLLETLDGLNDRELHEFNWTLRRIHRKYSSDFSWMWYMGTDLQDTVFLMVQTYGQQSVEKIMEVLKEMKRTDLAQRLSDCSSLPRKKHSVDERRSALIHKVATMAAVKHLLLETFNDLSVEELEEFKRLLQTIIPGRNRSYFSWRLSPSSNRADVVNLMVEELGHQSVEVTREVFMHMNRTDLVQKLPESSSASRGRKTERSSELEGCQSLTQDCSDWTKLKPEVNSTDADEAPTYSLQSAAGHFECRVSGLRWVCKGKTSFQYQFRSWEGHMERMESRQYMPAGPLMDVTVTAGKLNEVHLPHWICIDDVPDILDMFAVVHIDDCGDVVEKVSEVTPTHVKLTEPHFSLLAPLIRFIFPPKISCYTLMYYQLNTSFLKLHVYLIRQDPALEQEIAQKYCEKNDETKSHLNFQKIIKHPPDQYLQTERLFSLKADNTSAKIQPKKLTLRYNRQNFYEVYVKNPVSELILTLVHTHPADGEPADEPLWECEIRADDHPESGQAEAAGSSVGAAAVSSQSAEENTVDKHLSAQMQKALTVHSDREKLLEVLEDLKKEELEKFKWFLRDRDVLGELQPIPESQLEKASTCDLVDLMVQTYTEKSVEVTTKVLKKINRNDLVQICSF